MVHVAHVAVDHRLTVKGQIRLKHAWEATHGRADGAERVHVDRVHLAVNGTDDIVQTAAAALSAVKRGDDRTRLLRQSKPCKVGQKLFAELVLFAESLLFPLLSGLKPVRDAGWQ